MATLVNHQTVGDGFGNAREVYRIRYEFAKDGGATGALDILTADGPLMITHFHTNVIAAGASTGSATLKVGVTGDDDRFMNTTQGAVASLTLGAIIIPPALEGTPNVLPVPVKLATGEKILQTIGTEVLSVGTFEYVIEVMRV